MTPAKFKFDTEFHGAGDRVSLAARARTKKTMTADEIDQMCAKARSEGMKAGAMEFGVEFELRGCHQ